MKAFFSTRFNSASLLNFLHSEGGASRKQTKRFVAMAARAQHDGNNPDASAMKTFPASNWYENWLCLFMKTKLKPGSSIQLDGKQWQVTEISEDNEGQTVYHLKSGDELSVVKQSELPKDFK